MFRQHSAKYALRTGLLDGALRPRLVGRAESVSGPSWFALVLRTGRVWISDEDIPITGPAFVWRPWSVDSGARFSAGATGNYLLLGSSALASSIGHLPEAQDLHDFAALAVTKPLEQDEVLLETLQFSLWSMHRELDSDASGARAIAEAYLRVILIEVYRTRSSLVSTTDTTPPAHRAFRRFSDLVEQHFRDRWTVNQYAQELGMSRDRLGDICRRVRNLGPKEFIDRRVMREARAQLESSSLSIQQIGALLGFNSSPQFTRFFSRTAGLSPGSYRLQLHGKNKSTVLDRSLLHEWP